MRIGFGLILLFGSVVFAQSRGYGTSTSVGVVVGPGPSTGLPGVTRSLGSVVNPAQGGLRVPGSGFGGLGFGGGFGFNRGGGFVYPVYIGGYYSTPYLSPAADPSAAPPVDPSSAPPPAPSNVTVVMPPQQPVTPVVINYNYGPVAPPVPQGPEMTGARPPVAAAPSDDNVETSHYLIAFKDHTIYAVTAYWVDGDTLHYFTNGNIHNQASLSLVDREFTQRLNKEAGLDVKLPAPK
jgi:hypothetical protein